MTTAFLLVLLGVFARLNPDHIHNLVPIGAIALYAGARLPRWWAVAVPMAIMVVTDLLLDLYYYPQYGRGLFEPSRMAVYGSYLAMVLLGRWTSRDRKFAVPVAMTLAGSLLFFVVTNFATWASGMSLRPVTLPGLFACYGDAVPFYRATLLADLGGAVALFGLDAILRPVLAPGSISVAKPEPLAGVEAE
ncbi:DUF6580 family putative transport protein [Tautonia plasticadhaerens]|uniref:Uncharacterized protein n=1 Tax=Tautonia plasticadhaerens TaxID=2527974 RepID=A0A518HAR4_9BACT|nr:DUF6580 family putative transport protein [Tautonia plasticadhaerens]QDV37945.1 hypothetical protein ElP_58920 [Tautonia plasticadhaerens]